MQVGDSMVRPRTNRTQVTLRIEDHTQERAERVRAAYVEAAPQMRGFLPTVPPMLRLLIEKGLDVYEAELGLEPLPMPKPPPKSKPKPRKQAKP
jgi:hypothetical protein